MAKLRNISEDDPQYFTLLHYATLIKPDFISANTTSYGRLKVADRETLNKLDALSKLLKQTVKGLLKINEVDHASLYWYHDTGLVHIILSPTNSKVTRLVGDFACFDEIVKHDWQASSRELISLYTVRLTEHDHALLVKKYGFSKD